MVVVSLSWSLPRPASELLSETLSSCMDKMIGLYTVTIQHFNQAFLTGLSPRTFFRLFLEQDTVLLEVRHELRDRSKSLLTRVR